MRLFVAAYPPAEAVRDAAAQVAALRIGKLAESGVNVRLTRPETYHVTLAFLGEVDPGRLPRVEQAIARATEAWRSVAASRAGESADRRPRLSLAGGGQFGRGRFTVLWLGLAGDVAALGGLARALRRELRAARLPCDRRQFTPHLTIARPGERVTDTDVEADRATLAEYRGPQWPVTEVVLVRSHLGPRPSYDRLAAWPL